MHDYRTETNIIQRFINCEKIIPSYALIANTQNIGMVVIPFLFSWLLPGRMETTTGFQFDIPQVA